MKIYAIFEDNQQQWENSYRGIKEDDIYLDKKLADKACHMLNNTKYIPITQEQWREVIQEGEYTSWTIEEYNENQAEQFERDRYTYEVKELNIKESL